MPRSKPRYPMQLDNAFVEVCEEYAVDPFSMECMLVASLCLSQLGEAVERDTLVSVEHMLQKMSLKFTRLPYFTVATQASFPVD